MTTERRITQHDQIVDSSVSGIQRIIRDYWRGIEDQLLDADGLTNLQLMSIFNTSALNVSAIQQNLQNSLEDTPDMLEVEPLDSAPYVAQGVAEIEAENSAVGAVVLAALALALLSGGSIPKNRIRETVRSNTPRVERTVLNTVVHTDSAYGFAVMRDAGVERFTYRGGIAPNTREFCRSHNGKTYTEREIRRIWSSQSWGGKAPGDPFVTRGGYNCRHYWVPETGGEE